MINALIARLRVSSEFVFVIGIFVIGICFVLRVSDFVFNSCASGFAPSKGTFLRPPAQREERSLNNTP